MHGWAPLVDFVPWTYRHIYKKYDNNIRQYDKIAGSLELANESSIDMISNRIEHGISVRYIKIASKSFTVLDY